MKKRVTQKMSIAQQRGNTTYSKPAPKIKTNRHNKPLSFIAGIHNHLVNISQLILSVIALSLALSSTAYAHRGAKGEVDTCRFSVGKEVVHFSAYTPASSKGKSYCHAIPYVESTTLVIDYEGTKLRHTTVEFEVTKEPEGTRIFYQKPEKFKKGSIDFKINFAQYGAGDYLTHVTLMNEGEVIDAHLPFSVGVDPEDSGLPYKIIIPFFIIVTILAVMFGMSKKPEED